MGQHCTACGAELREGSSFCVRCGTSSSVAPQSAATSVAAPVVAPAAPPQLITATTPIAVENPANPMRRMVLAGVIALVLTLLVRLVISVATSEPKPSGEIVAQLPVGPEGGKTKIDGGGAIKVPPGALKKKTTIQVRRSNITDRIRAVSPTGTTIVIPAGAQVIYIFTPANLTFAVPVLIALPLPPAPNQGLVFLSSNNQITFVNARAGGASTVNIRVNSFNFADSSAIVRG